MYECIATVSIWEEVSTTVFSIFFFMREEKKKKQMKMMDRMRKRQQRGCRDEAEQQPHCIMILHGVE